jgi:hypothetical protein
MAKWLKGLSLNKFLTDIEKEAIHTVKHGSHELSAGLFTGSPFIMYSRGENNVEDQKPELPPEPERGGREM